MEEKVHAVALELLEEKESGRQKRLKEEKQRKKEAKKRAKAGKKIRKNRTMQIAKVARRQLPQLLMQSLAIVLTAVGSFMFMTWLIRDLLDVKHIYASAGLELAGMLGFLTILLVWETLFQK